MQVILPNAGHGVPASAAARAGAGPLAALMAKLGTPGAQPLIVADEDILVRIVYANKYPQFVNVLPFSGLHGRLLPQKLKKRKPEQLQRLLPHHLPVTDNLGAHRLIQQLQLGPRLQVLEAQPVQARPLWVQLARLQPLQVVLPRQKPHVIRIVPC